MQTGEFKVSLITLYVENRTNFGFDCIFGQADAISVGLNTFKLFNP